MRKLGLLLILMGGVMALSSGIIDLDDLFNYSDQEIPSYITKDNTRDNPISDEVATLGRVLFYDKKLSSDNGTACASCHQQDVAFSDKNAISIGSFGLTGRHSMRLINARFSDEERFFWDERALTLEDQTTMPIQDHVEMGFSGENGDPDINDLIDKLSEIEYYETLFEFAFGDSEITEERMQMALAQFIRSIQSFDSKYDAGRSVSGDDLGPFVNFTQEENEGKRLFHQRVEFGDEGNRIAGGLGCAACHVPPEFSIDPQSRSNGVFLAVNGFDVDEGIFRSPTLRDLFNPAGELNGPLMHNALFPDMRSVLEHYNDIEGMTGESSPPILDARLKDGRFVQKLNMTEEEFANVEAFLRTLTGSDVYTNEKWSNPFDADGNLEIVRNPVSTADIDAYQIKLYPNPAVDRVIIENTNELFAVHLIDLKGKRMKSTTVNGQENVSLDVSDMESGVFLVQGMDERGEVRAVQRLVKL